jgi:hypothetical protein
MGSGLKIYAADETPDLGVLTIIQRVADGTMAKMVQENDFYIFDGTFWISHDLPGLLRRLRSRKPFWGFLEGAHVADPIFEEALKSTYEDQDFVGLFTAEQIAEFVKTR